MDNEHDISKQVDNNSLNEFKKSYGEEFSNTIDLDTWRVGENLADLYPQIEEEIKKAKRDEFKTHQALRDNVFPRIKEKATFDNAGLHSDVDVSTIEKVHKGFLFNGAVTACGSVSAVFDSVPISITQIGICLVNYQGQHGSYSHRLYRRDLRFKGDDPIKEAINLIEKRHTDEVKGSSAMSTLAVRGIKAYAERAILLNKSESNWLMSRGTPTPYELMTGFWASRPEMKAKAIGLMSNLVSDHKKFVYVQSGIKNQLLWTFGNALKPYEFLAIDTMEDNLARMVELGGTRGEFRESYQKFAQEIGSQIVYGVYKVSNHSQPHVFYCHRDHIQIAALIAIADGVLQTHKGSPMLLDLAGDLCKNAFGKNDFIASIEQANTKVEVTLGNET